jgi:ketosteroid isomerase-like protein
MAGEAEVVLRIFDAINRGDIEAAITETAPDVIVDFSASHSPYHGVYEGREAVGKFWSDWLGAWEQLHWQPEDLREAPPGRVVLVNHLTGRGAGSGIEIDARGGHVWEVEHGKVRRMKLFQSGVEARRAAGLDD